MPRVCGTVYKEVIGGKGIVGYTIQQIQQDLNMLRQNNGTVFTGQHKKCNFVITSITLFYF